MYRLCILILLKQILIMREMCHDTSMHQQIVTALTVILFADHFFKVYLVLSLGILKPFSNHKHICFTVSHDKVCLCKVFVINFMFMTASETGASNLLVYLCVFSRKCGTSIFTGSKFRDERNKPC